MIQIILDNKLSLSYVNVGKESAVETVLLALMIATPDCVEIDVWQLRLPRIYSGWWVRGLIVSSLPGVM